MNGAWNYDAVGATEPASVTWSSTPAGYRRYEHSVRIGQGAADWARVTDELRRWGIKTRSGFTVTPVGSSVHEDEDYTLTARIGFVSVREPVRVVAVVDVPDRCGFSYGTLEGHPVSGEEAFILHRTSDGTVWLTLRSLTRPARGIWYVAFPALLIAQRYYRGRYLRALQPPSP